MKIVVLDGYAANLGDLNRNKLRTLGECEIYDRTAPEKVLTHTKDAEAILTNKATVTAGHMASLPNLRYIGVITTGYNTINIAATEERGIVVTNIPAYSTPSVGQMAFARTLNIAQRIQHYADKVRGRQWTRNQDLCYWSTSLIELLGKKTGLIELGQTRYNTARIAIRFEMKVWTYTSRSRPQLPPEIRKTELGQIFRKCGIVSLHCPLVESIRDLVNAHRLELMRPDAILINTSRNPLINEQDLADALGSYKIYTAGLDALFTEPPRAGNPLLTTRNYYTTPHIAQVTSAAREHLMTILVNSLEAYIGGKPMNSVAK